MSVKLCMLPHNGVLSQGTEWGFGSSLSRDTYRPPVEVDLWDYCGTLFLEFSPLVGLGFYLDVNVYLFLFYVTIAWHCSYMFVYCGNITWCAAAVLLVSSCHRLDGSLNYSTIE